MSSAAGIRPLLEANNLKKHFSIGRFGKAATLRAVDGVSISVNRGETLGIVGESGCGKSTTARLLLQLVMPDAGDIVYEGAAVSSRSSDLRKFRRKAQMVFQDSHSSLNPRLTILETVMFSAIAVGEPKSVARDKALAILEQVNLDPERFASMYPHELSGGQRQRVNIARAFAINPELVIFDEAVAALDKSVEAQILTLIQDLQRKRDLTYIFISHDLNVVQYLCDRIVVMYLGKVVEEGGVADVYDNPRHPYTAALLKSRLSFDPDVKTAAAPLAGDVPSPIDPPSGCRFRTRCPIAADICATSEPVLDADHAHPSHRVACHFAPGAARADGRAA